MWKRVLTQTIETGICEIDIQLASADDKCAFGRWMNDGVPWRCRKAWDYANVRRRHAAFHTAVGEVLTLALSGRAHAATEAMAPGGAFQQASAQLSAALADWRIGIGRQADGTGF